MTKIPLSGEPGNEAEAEDRLSDFQLAEELEFMSDRLYGLEVAVKAVCEDDTPFDNGVCRLAVDASEAMANLTARFEAERRLRLVQKDKDA